MTHHHPSAVLHSEVTGKYLGHLQEEGRDVAVQGCQVYRCSLPADILSFPQQGLGAQLGLSSELCSGPDQQQQELGGNLFIKVDLHLTRKRGEKSVLHEAK